MLSLSFPELELYDEINNEFIYLHAQTIQLEHSLMSLSKWESKYHKPFLTKTKKTRQETIDYIICMTITPNVDYRIYQYGLTDEKVKKVNDYIDDPMTGTTISKRNERPNREIVSAELIYYWMIALNIPFECQKWHLNRLLTLIQVCEIKNSPGKKMTQQETIASNKKLNEERRRAFNSKG